MNSNTTCRPFLKYHHSFYAEFTCTERGPERGHRSFMDRMMDCTWRVVLTVKEADRPSPGVKRSFFTASYQLLRSFEIDAYYRGAISRDYIRDSTDYKNTCSHATI